MPPTRTRMLGVVLAAVVAGSLVVVPGASATTGARVRPAAPRVTKRVNVVDFAFMPKSVTIAKDTYVKWVNASGRTHTTTSNTGLWNRSLAPGGVYKRQFRVRGTFRYRCTIHSEYPYYMTGKIIVT
jgi:plastocyanin